jgi:hypothetical protein
MEYNMVGSFKALFITYPYLQQQKPLVAHRANMTSPRLRVLSLKEVKALFFGRDHL